MAKSKPVTLFGTVAGDCFQQELQSCYSPVFEVTDRPVVVRGWNFGPGANSQGEKVFLEMVAGANDGEHFEQVNAGCGCCMTLSACTNELVIAKSGRYRLNRCVCDTTNPPTNTELYVEYQTLETGAQVTIGDNAMACKCTDGSLVTVTQSGTLTTIVVDNVPYTIDTGGDTVTAVNNGNGTTTVTINGVPFVLDNTPDAALTAATVLGLLSFTNCAGSPHVAGAQIPTCSEMTAAIAASAAATQAAANVVLTDAFGVRIGAIFP